MSKNNLRFGHSIIYSVMVTSISEDKMTSYMHIGAGMLLVLLVLLAATVKLESAPSLWWDEGWTLSVARNWVEQGHYGRLLEGKPAPPGLEATFPVSFPVSFTFWLFGVGVWQGRLPILLYML